MNDMNGMNNNSQPMQPGMDPNQQMPQMGMDPNQQMMQMGMDPNQQMMQMGMDPNQQMMQMGMDPNQQMMQMGMNPNQQMMQPGMDPNQQMMQMGMDPNQQMMQMGMNPNQQMSQMGMDPNQQMMQPGMDPNQQMSQMGMDPNQQMSQMGMDPNQQMSQMGMNPNQQMMQPGMQPNNGVAPQMGQQPAPQPATPTKSKGSKVIIALIAIVVLLAGGFYLHISNPKTIFKYTMNSMTKLTGVFQKNFSNKSRTVITYKMNTDFAELKAYSGIERTIVSGIDTTNGNVEFGIQQANATNSGILIFVKDGKTYLKFQSLNKVICLDETQQYSSLAKTLEELTTNMEGDLTPQEQEYLSKKIIDIISSNIDSKDIKKTSEKVSLNGKEISVKANTYTITKDVIVKQMNGLIKGLKNDKKAMEILEKIKSDDDKTFAQEIKESKEITSEDIGDMSEIYVTVYTSGAISKSAGYKIASESSTISFITNGTDFEFSAKSGDNEVIHATGVKEKDITNVTFNADSLKGTMVVRKFEEGNIDFDYTLNAAEVEYSGTLKMTGNIEDMKGDFSLKDGKNNFAIEFTTKVDKNAKVSDYDISTITPVYNEDTIAQELLNELRGTLLGDLLNSYATSSSVAANPYNMPMYKKVDPSSIF